MDTKESQWVWGCQCLGIFDSVSSLIQQSEERQIAPFGHTILSLNQPVLGRTPLNQVVTGTQSKH